MEKTIDLTGYTEIPCTRWDCLDPTNEAYNTPDVLIKRIKEFKGDEAGLRELIKNYLLTAFEQGRKYCEIAVKRLAQEVLFFK